MRRPARPRSDWDFAKGLDSLPLDTPSSGLRPIAEALAEIADFELDPADVGEEGWLR